MSNNFKLLILTLLLSNLQILKFSNCLAQNVPHKFNYQGIAREANGNPMSKQTLGLKISILSSESANEAEYEEVQTVTTNEYGLYSLQIGNGTAIKGEMKMVLWESGNKYIKVAIDPKGGTDYTDMGTTQLLSVPYAIYADRAGSAKNGGVNSNRATNNFIEKTNGSGVVNSTSQIFDNGTNIGIGTTTPQAKIHVNATGGTNELRIQNNGGSPRLSFFGDNSTAFTATANYALMYKRPASDPGNFSSGFPNAKLFIFGNSQGSLLFNTGGNVGFGYFNQSANTTNTNLFVEGLTGKVGIGTTIPSTKLEVKGGEGDLALMSGDFSIGNSIKRFRIGFDTTAGHATLAGSDLIALGSGISYPELQTLVITNNKVGIGGMLPTEKLDVQGKTKTTDLQITNGANTNYILQSDIDGNASWVSPSVAETDPQVGALNSNQVPKWGTTSLINSSITDNGNVGIGTLVPGAKLEVNGQVKITGGSPGSGKFLQSDANGLASWEPASNAAWALGGNANTVPGTNYIGTSDNQDVVFKRNGIQAGLISQNNLALGENALSIPTISTGNTAIGNYALQNNVNGDGNTAIGRSALQSNNAGYDNVGIGVSALHNNNGISNIGIGSFALYSNLSGDRNVGIGVGALLNDASGDGNVSIGAFTLYSTTNGLNNVAIGDSALFNAGNENVGIGSKALKSYSGNASVAIGFEALNKNNGVGNTTVGYKSLSSNTTGARNTALGNRALNANTSANNNTAIGYYALRSNSSGENNTANGTFALEYCTTGSNNTVIGYNSANNSNGSKNVIVGSEAFTFNSSGNNNVALGYNSLAYNSGSFNVAIGTSALMQSSSSGNMVAIGDSALQSNTSGIANLALGAKVLMKNTSGNNNTAIGLNALKSNTTGKSNTAVGSNVLIANTNGDYNLAIGDSAMVSSTGGSSNIAIGFKSGNKMSGTFSNVAVGHKALEICTSGNDNTTLGAWSASSYKIANSIVAIGSGTLQNDTSAFGNTALGASAGTTYSGPNSPIRNKHYNTFIGSGTGANVDTVSNSTALGYGARVSANNQVRIGGSGTTSIGGAQAWSVVSDKRLKKDVQHNVPGLAFITKLKPVTYKMDNEAYSKIANRKLIEYYEKLGTKEAKLELERLNSISQFDSSLRSGFLAQDVEQEAVKLGYQFEGVDAPKNENDFYSLRYSSFVVPLVKAVQEQQALIEQLQKENDEIKSQFEQLKKLILESNTK